MTVKPTETWQTLIADGEEIYAGTVAGSIASISLEDGIIDMINTNLDIPYLFSFKDQLMAIGRWNCSPTYWKKSTKETVQKKSLFTGRVTAVYSDNNHAFIAGSNKGTPSGYENYKDKVSLLPGEIYRFGQDQIPFKLGIETNGSIVHLLAFNNTIIFVQDSETNTIVIVKPDKSKKEIVSKSGQIMTLNRTKNWLSYATASEVVQTDLNGLEIDIIKSLPDSFARVLKLIKYKNETFLLNSKGLFKLSNLKQINEHDGQPTDFTIYNNGILTLWGNGAMEFYQVDQQLKKLFLI